MIIIWEGDFRSMTQDLLPRDSKTHQQLEDADNHHRPARWSQTSKWVCRFAGELRRLDIDINMFLRTSQRRRILKIPRATWSEQPPNEDSEQWRSRSFHYDVSYLAFPDSSATTNSPKAEILRWYMQLLWLSASYHNPCWIMGQAFRCQKSVWGQSVEIADSIACVQSARYLQQCQSSIGCTPHWHRAESFRGVSYARRDSKYVFGRSNCADTNNATDDLRDLRRCFYRSVFTCIELAIEGVANDNSIYDIPKYLVCTYCGHKKPLDARKRGPCGNRDLVYGICDTSARIALLFILFRQNNLWPLLRYEIEEQSFESWMEPQNNTLHQCLGKNDCPLSYTKQQLISLDIRSPPAI